VPCLGALSLSTARRRMRRAWRRLLTKKRQRENDETFSRVSNGLSLERMSLENPERSMARRRALAILDSTSREAWRRAKHKRHAENAEAVRRRLRTSKVALEVADREMTRAVACSAACCWMRKNARASRSLPRAITAESAWRRRRRREQNRRHRDTEWAKEEKRNEEDARERDNERTRR
jgi:hypothetical protein